MTRKQLNCKRCNYIWLSSIDPKVCPKCHLDWRDNDERKKLICKRCNYIWLSSIDPKVCPKCHLDWRVEGQIKICGTVKDIVKYINELQKVYGQNKNINELENTIKQNLILP